MKSKTNWGLVILIGLFIIGSIVLYWTYILHPQLQQIKQLNNDIEDVKRQIQQKETELLQLDSVRAEIAECENEIATANRKILPYKEFAHKMYFFESSAQLNDLIIKRYTVRNGKRKSVSLSGEYIEDIDKLPNGEFQGDLEYRELLVEMEVGGYYESVNTYLEQLKANIKPFTIYYVKLTTDIDETFKEYMRGYYNIDLNSNMEGYVLATIYLRTFSLYNGQQADDEIINRNYMEYDFEYNNPIREIEKLQEKIYKEIGGNTAGSRTDELRDFIKEVSNLVKPPITPVNPGTEEPGVKTFKIAIKDAYESGDNYYIVGPGDSGEYTTVQATTIQPATFDLVLNPNGYQYSLTTVDEGTKSFSKQMELGECRLVIDSTVLEPRESQLLHTTINITNNTGKVLRVEVNGRYKDRISIFSTKSSTQINPGEVVDNIMVVYK